MRCPNCDNEVPEGKRFCGYCGQRLTPVEADAPTPVPDVFDDEAPTQLVTPVPEETSVEPAGEPEPSKEETPEKPETPRRSRPAPAPDPRPKPPSKRRSRKWVWAVIAVAVVAVAVLSNTGRSEPDQPETSFIWLFETGDEIWMRADENLILTGNWIADTQELVSEYIESLHIEITLDGNPLPDPTTYWGEVHEYGDFDDDGDWDYISSWHRDLGTLSPGTHQLEITVQSRWSVIDGFDSDGDGELDEFDYDHENQLSIIVEE